VTGLGRTVTLRRAEPADATAVADLFLASFHATYDFALAHSDDEVREWIAGDLLVTEETWVAEAAGQVVGMMALDEHGIGQLYIAPDRIGQGLGSAFVGLAKQRRPDGLDLYTFQVNTRARRFYERHGFVVEMLGDGSGNEEGQPDVLYRWRP
jgi:ribosomal protein S18 acetylase RimI-like enzyme